MSTSRCLCSWLFSCTTRYTMRLVNKIKCKNKTHFDIIFFFSVENLAYRKRISLNDFLYSSTYSSQQTYLSYLNDGYDVPSRCTIIDSTRCINSQPHITIDLNRIYNIHGVIIQQLDTCKQFKHTNNKSFFCFSSSFTFISR